MAITLQSTGEDFSTEFINRLPELENAMLAHGLEPSRFVIAKNSVAAMVSPRDGQVLCSYTVFVDGDHFTVAETSDLKFLNYFHERCVAEDEGAISRKTPPRGPGLIRRLVRWMMPA